MRHVLPIAAIYLASLAHAQEIVEIPPLAPLTNTHILDLSADGTVALCVSQHIQDRTWRRYFTWNPATGAHQIPSHPDWPHTWANAISGDGRVVVGGAHRTNGEAGIAWRWTHNAGYEDLALPAGSKAAFAEGTNVDGSVVVGTFVQGDRAFAYRWSEATGMVDLGELPGLNYHYARYVSDDGGVVVGIAANDDGLEERMPFRWTAAEGLTALGHPPGEDGFVSMSDLSTDGLTVITNYITLSGPGSTPYLWRADPGEYIAFADVGYGLGDLGSDSYMEGMSSDRSVFVGAAIRGPTLDFAWTPSLGVVELHAYLRARGVDASAWAIDGISEDGAVLIASNPYQPARAALITNFTLPTTCPADIDLNERLDTFDFLAFLNRFNEGDLRADFDADGQLTIADFLAFQTAFDAGC